MNKGFAP